MDLVSTLHRVTLPLWTKDLASIAIDRPRHYHPAQGAHVLSEDRNGTALQYPEEKRAEGSAKRPIGFQQLTNSAKRGLSEA